MSAPQNTPLTIALPSKGRLKEQCEAWLAEAGFKLVIDGGDRGYRASLRGLPGAEIRLLSAGDIATMVDSGEVHLGVTGEDLLRERPEGVDERVMLLRALGFGFADLVVAAPQSWIDVETMADVEEVAQAYLARTGLRLRVTTKYTAQTRAFFARHGVVDYRIVESLGATEGAPAAGAAELVVDITSTGATLAANNLKIIGDGTILKSQAQLAASLRATWTQDNIDQLRRLVSTVEARVRAKGLAALTWPEEQHDKARAAIAPFLAQGDAHRHHALIDAGKLIDAGAALSAAGVGPVGVSRMDYVFDPACPAVDALRARLGV